MTILNKVLYTLSKRAGYSHNKNMQVGFIGFGKMGSRMAGKLSQGGHKVIVWNRSKEVVEEFKKQNSKVKSISQNLEFKETIIDLVLELKKPRVIWMMLPHGDATQTILNEILKYVESGDIIIDGGNAFYRDT